MLHRLRVRGCTHQAAAPSLRFCLKNGHGDWENGDGPGRATKQHIRGLLATKQATRCPSTTPTTDPQNLSVMRGPQGQGVVEEQVPHRG